MVFMDINFTRFLLFIVVSLTILAFIHFAVNLRLFWKERQYKGVLLILFLVVFLGSVFSFILYRLLPMCGF